MWVVMMIAMMDHPWPDAVALSLTVLVGYFFIWTVFGIVAFALGVPQIEMALAS